MHLARDLLKDAILRYRESETWERNTREEESPSIQHSNIGPPHNEKFALPLRYKHRHQSWLNCNQHLTRKAVSYSSIFWLVDCRIKKIKTSAESPNNKTGLKHFFASHLKRSFKHHISQIDQKSSRRIRLDQFFGSRRLVSESMSFLSTKKPRRTISKTFSRKWHFLLKEAKACFWDVGISNSLFIQMNQEHFFHLNGESLVQSRLGWCVCLAFLYRAL